MTPTAEEMLTKLTTLFVRTPNFKKHWGKHGDNWRDKAGSFTLWGLFMEFGVFVRDNWNEIPEQKRKELMDFIESCLIDGDKDDNLDNAVCTCFLEFFAGREPMSVQMKKHMGPKSLRFFNGWGS